MKVIDQLPVAQGDVLFFRVDRLPDGLTLDPDPAPIVAHSETGHHHRVRARDGYKVERLVQDPLTSFLRIRKTGAKLRAQADGALAKIDEALVGAVGVHEKEGPDAHEAVGFACGEEEVIYQANRQVELRPDGWAAVQD